MIKKRRVRKNPFGTGKMTPEQSQELERQAEQEEQDRIEREREIDDAAEVLNKVRL